MLQRLLERGEHIKTGLSVKGLIKTEIFFNKKIPLFTKLAM